MEMAAQIINPTNLIYLKILFVLFMCQLIIFTQTQTQNFSSFPTNLTNCDSSSQSQHNNILASGFHCNNQQNCQTFAILRPKTRFSSLTNLTSYLGLSRHAVAEANSFSVAAESLPKDQPFLVPIRCECDAFSGFFRAHFDTNLAQGQTFSEISESLQGLTTCEAIKEENPNVSPWNNHLVIPIQCACSDQVALFLTYPVTNSDTLSLLAAKFNTTKQAILLANNATLKPFSSLLIPVTKKPVFGSVYRSNFHSKKPKMKRIGLYIALSGIFVGTTIAIAAIFILIHMKKKQSPSKSGHGNGHDLELQQLSLSVRTTSDKKVSFDGSNQDTLDGSIITSVATPRKNKPVLESYTIEELSKATEDFNSSNHIEGSVYHGRLNGKNLAIKRVNRDYYLSKVDLALFNDTIHRHPNIMRIIGTCLNEEKDTESFIVFEYAKNGSLKDWLHNGLAIKNQFISSCYCFLTWTQRLRICFDIAMALQYMHHIMEPCYVHRNIKSRNIFLDEEFNAKLGNFGMENCDEQNSDGYFSPEFIHRGVISSSMDIYAYGVVLLEILTGKTPISRGEEKGGDEIRIVEGVKRVLESEKEEEMREWVDRALGESYSFDGAVTLAKLAKACTEEEPALRPTAEELAEKIARLVRDSPSECGLVNVMVMSESCSKPLVKSCDC